MEREEVLKLVKEAVHEVDDKAEIILFGSRARGDFQKESDWDFLILTDNGEDFQIRKEIRNRLFYKELESGEVFSLIIHSQEYWNKLRLSLFYREVEKDGIIL